MDSNIKHMLVNTVRNNFKGHTKHDIAKAKKARRLQGMVGNPTDREFNGMVREKLITNCPITVQDVENANTIFGPDLANLRGETIRTKPEHVRIEYVQIPRDFVELHKYVTLMADVMFVNGLPFLVTSLRGISLVTVEYLKSRTAKRLVHTLERVVRIYGAAGFIMQTALMDMEFKKLKDKLPNVILNTTAAREHVGEIERKIRVVKERVRCTTSILPYNILLKLMIIELMHFPVMWMNSFPVKSGISKRWSPREIVSRHRRLDAKLHCKVPFGAYCEVHVDPDITDTMEPRTRWAICLGPTGNMQGSYKFLSLMTEKKVTRRKFAEMPMTDSVIRRINSLGNKSGLLFKNRKGEEYVFDNEEEYDMIAEARAPAPFPEVAGEAPGILTKQEELMGVDEVVQREPEPSNKERTTLTAANPGIDFSSPPEERPHRGEIIEILDDEDN